MPNNAVIFGDSYSTFEGYNPKGYATYYSIQDPNESGVTKKEETWWHQVMDEGHFNLLHNNSWSGSTICYTGYDGDCSRSSSFIYRLEQKIEEGFFEQNEINTVFVMGATNDAWSGADCGEMKYDNFEKADLYKVLPAISYFFKTLRNAVPQAKIYCMINADYLTPEITKGFQDACGKYDLVEVYIKDLPVAGGHPTVEGMEHIKNCVMLQVNQ